MMENKDTTYVASDLHIGYEDSNYPKMVEFFEIVKVDADRLILLGDVLDLWRAPIKTITNNEPYKTAYDALVKTTHHIPTHVVWGNHDYELKRIMQRLNAGQRIATNITDDFVEDNIYYCHGWKFDAQQRFGSMFYWWLVSRFPYLYQRFFKTPPQIPRGEYARGKLTSKIHAEAKRFAEKCGYAHIVMGHTHDPTISGKLVDCGDFVDSLSYIIIEDGVPELRRIKR